MMSSATWQSEGFCPLVEVEKIVKTNRTLRRELVAKLGRCMSERITGLQDIKVCVLVQGIRATLVREGWASCRIFVV